MGYLDARINLDNGLPDRSIFWCGNERYTIPIGDDALVQRIKDC